MSSEQGAEASPSLRLAPAWMGWCTCLQTRPQGAQTHQLRAKPKTQEPSHSPKLYSESALAHLLRGKPPLLWAGPAAAPRSPTPHPMVTTLRMCPTCGSTYIAPPPHCPPMGRLLSWVAERPPLRPGHRIVPYQGRCSSASQPLNWLHEAPQACAHSLRPAPPTWQGRGALGLQAANCGDRRQSTHRTDGAREAVDALPRAGVWWLSALAGLKDVRLLPSTRLPGAPVGVSSQLPNFLFSQENLAAEALKSSLKCLPGVPDVLGSLQHLSA